MPPQPWKTLTTREIYKNKWMRLREDIAEMPNGKTTIYGVCEFGQCVAVLPFVDDKNVVMVRQYRYTPKSIIAGRCRAAASAPARPWRQPRSAS